jgi:predicted PurR-regulated permease PerM
LFSVRCPRWLAIILAISLAVGFFVMFGFMIYSAVISIENDWATYEAGAERVRHMGFEGQLQPLSK